MAVMKVGTLFILTGPTTSEVLGEVQSALDAKEFVFVDCMSTAAEPTEGTTETSADRLTNLSDLGLLSLRWKIGDHMFAVSSGIGQLLAKGRSVVIHGHENVRQPARRSASDATSAADPHCSFAVLCESWAGW